MLATILEERKAELLPHLEAGLSSAAFADTNEVRRCIPFLVQNLIGSLRGGESVAAPSEPFLRLGVDSTSVLLALLVFKSGVHDLIEDFGAPVSARELRIFSDWFAHLTTRIAVDQNRRLGSMLDAVADNVALRDLSGRWIYANRAAKRTVEAVIGEQTMVPNLADFPIYGEVTRAFDENAARALNGETLLEEVRFPSPDGWQWFEHHVAPMRDADGAIEAVVFAGRNTHARKTAEARLEAMMLEAQEAKEEIARALAFREEMMGVLGHDLRNPLSAVSGLAGVLGLKEGVPQVVREGLNRIVQAAKRMTEMIETLLDVTQARAQGGIRISRESTDLCNVCRLVVDELRIGHPNREINLELAGDLLGFWDPARMAQVISNLVANALTHGDQQARVEVVFEGEHSTVELRVTSRGAPIPPDMAEQIFEPFQRGSRANRSRGLGLGLSIVRQIVHAHGGSVSVRSTSDSNCFVVQLPRTAE